MSKFLPFSSEIIFGQLLLTFGDFLLVTLILTDKSYVSTCLCSKDDDDEDEDEGKWERYKVNKRQFTPSYDIMSFRYYGLTKFWEGSSGCVSYATVWPDMAKFRQVGKILKVFGQFFGWLIVFGKLLYQIWHFLLLGKFSLL